MNELKAYDFVDIQDYRGEVYLKSEADKVFAELKMKLAAAKLVPRLNEPKALYSNLDTMSRLNHKIDVVERRELHQKYKRCLAMADACRGNFLVAEHMIEKEPKNLMWHKRHKHYGRWMMLWRCFAEKFKEAE